MPDAQDNTVGGAENPLTPPRSLSGEGESTEAPAASVDSPITLKDEPVYRAIRDFKTVLDGTFVEFHQGDLINDPTVISALLKEKSPIVPVDEDHRYVVCPACRHQFPILE